MKKFNSNRGFIRDIFIILVALIALKYFVHIDVVGYLSEGPVTKGLDWAKVHIWEKYIHS